MVTPGGGGVGYRNTVGMLQDEVAVPGSGVFRCGPPIPTFRLPAFFFRRSSRSDSRKVSADSSRVTGFARRGAGRFSARHITIDRAVSAAPLKTRKRVSFFTPPPRPPAVAAAEHQLGGGGGGEERAAVHRPLVARNK